MRVLIVHNQYRQPGGEERVVSLEADLARQHGYEVEVWNWRSDSISSVADKIKTAFLLPYSEESKIKCLEKIRAFRPDLVHVHNFFPLITPAVHEAAKLACVPSVQTLHNYRIICANGLFLRDGRACELCLDGSALNGVRYGCYNGSRAQSFAMYRMIQKNRGTWPSNVSRFVVLTEFAKERYLRFGIPDGQIFVKPNFIFDPRPGGPSPYSERKRKAVFVGRLSEEKGVRQLLAAWDFPGWELHIVGAGELETELREKYSAPSVVFHGWRDQNYIYSQLDSASLLVFPSLCYENFPISLLEAMAHGVPVLAARTGGVPEIIRHGEDGVLFSHDVTGDLKHKLSELLGNESARGRYADSGRRRFLELYSPEINFSLLDRLYRDVVKDSK